MGLFSQCLVLYKTHDASLNYWWNNKRAENEDLIRYLCVDTLMICCPDGHYGALCKKCPGGGGPFNVCSKHGQCRGDGTKKGSGKCVCHKGYTGEACEKCELGFYLDKSEHLLLRKPDGEEEASTDRKEGETISCLPCDKACAFHCRGKGPRGCEVCKTGFYWDNEYGCVDIDECIEMKRNPCKKNTFCVNTEGAYFCYGTFAFTNYRSLLLLNSLFPK